MNPEVIRLFVPILSLVFGAGGAWFFIKQSRKDVNGLGQKVNNEIAQTQRRHINVCLALMLLASDDATRNAIAAQLKE